MKRKLWLASLLALLLAAILAPAAYAGGLADDKVVVGENYVLAAGQRLDGNLAVIGGNATLERDSVITGDVAVMGGTLTVAGSVRGSVAAFGGAVTLADSAVVEGDLAIFGGSTERAAGATVMGEVFGPRLPELPIQPRTSETPAVPDQSGRRSPVNPLGSLLLWEVTTLGWVIGLILLGVVALLVAPKAMARIASTVAAGPAFSFGVGLLTLVVALLGGALLLIACGLGLLVWLVTFFALLVGWLAVGLWAGQRLLQMLKVRNASALGEMALGVFLITILARLPLCIGFLFSVIIGAAGLGAVVLTRFGTQSPSHSTGGAPAASTLSSSSGVLTPVSAPDTGLTEAPFAPDLDAGAEPPLVPDESPATTLPVAEAPIVVPPVLPVELSGPIASLMDDDLEMVIGIGPEEADRLRAAGVNTVADLAAADSALLGSAIGVPVERIVNEDWIGQARRLQS
ncbi:MAG: polymer-forming cytoskeletal protein [Chloroflexi bacterium]|nr:polymer-forming cytoskeletal protein [Chloroflexota bacterium]